jgi:hypothetical protein
MNLDFSQLPLGRFIVPVALGAVAWFGVNYAWLSPSVITPRIAEKYYMPQCVGTVETLRAAYLEEVDSLRMQAIITANAAAQSVKQAAANTPRNVFGALLQSYEFFGLDTEQDRQFRAHYLDKPNQQMDELSDKLANNQVTELSSAAAAQQSFSSWQNQFQKEQAEERKNQKHLTAEAYCGCNWSMATAERFDMAMHSATLRFYVPPVLAELQNNAAFVDECGKAPVV